MGQGQPGHRRGRSPMVMVQRCSARPLSWRRTSRRRSAHPRRHRRACGGPQVQMGMAVWMTLRILHRSTAVTGASPCAVGAAGAWRDARA